MKDTNHFTVLFNFRNARIRKIISNFVGMFILFFLNPLWAQDHISLNTSQDLKVLQCNNSSTPYMYEFKIVPPTSGGITFNGVTYVSAGNNDFLFVLYDVDGNILMVKQFGGTGNETPTNASINCSNNAIYICGMYTGTTTLGTVSFTSKGDVDGFLIKIYKNGTFHWAKTIGSKYYDYLNFVGSDNSGRVVIAGSFNVTSSISSDYQITGTSSVNFIPPNPPSSTFYNITDIFVVSYDINGNFIFQNAIGAEDGNESTDGLEVTQSGEFYVVGSFFGPTGRGSGVVQDKVYFGSTLLQLPSKVLEMSYIGFMALNGNLITTSPPISAVSIYRVWPYCVTALDNNASLIIAGGYTSKSISFLTSSGPPITFNNPTGNSQAFVARYNGYSFDWAQNVLFPTAVTNNTLDIQSLVYDKFGNIIVAGPVLDNPYQYGSNVNSSGNKGVYIGVSRNDNSGSTLCTWSGSSTVPGNCRTGLLKEKTNNKFLLNGNALSASTQFGTLSSVAGKYSYNFALIKLSPYSFASQCPSNIMNFAWSVPFTAGSGNVYSVELSDINGSFTTPTVIGTTSSTSTNWTIPSAITSSDKYKVRIKSSDPVFYSRESDPFKIVNLTSSPKFTFNSNCVNQSANFSGDATIDGESITAWSWDFGDPGSSGNTASGQNVSHTYTVNGSYNVTLTVTISSGCTRTSVTPITIGSPATPYFSYVKNCLGTATEFTCPYLLTGITITAWDWNFGDGSTHGTVQNPTHTYSSIGNYTVTVNVTLSTGCVATYSTTVSIINLPPKPTITATPSNLNTCVDESIKLTSSVTSGYQFTWYDGTTATGTNDYQYTFTVPFTFSNLTYSLTLTSPNGCSTASDPITFTPHPVYSQIGCSSTVVCPGSTLTLSAVNNYPGQSYQWQVSTDNGASWNTVSGGSNTLTVSTSGWYKCYVYNTYCGEWSNVIVINAWTNSFVSSLTGNLITPGSSIPLRVDNSSGPVGSITWYRDGIPVLGPGSNPLYGASGPGNYYAISNGTCGLERTSEFPVYWDNASAWDNTYISGGTITSATTMANPSGYHIGNQLVIDAGGDLTISGTYLLMDPCSEIIVKNGGKLTIDATKVGTSNPQNWKRIYVQDGSSSVYILNGSEVWNADFGVICNNSGTMEIKNSSFGNNGWHFAAVNTTFSGRNTIWSNKIGHIQDPTTTLSCNATSGISGFSPNRGIWVLFLGSGSGSVDMRSNLIYQNKKYSSNSTGLVLNGANLHYIMGNTFNGFFDACISITGGAAHSILGNTLTRPHEMIYALGSTIFRQKTGIISNLAYNCMFDGNRLENWENGIEYYRISTTSEPNTTFQNNKFLDNLYGLVIADNEHPVNCNPTANNINNPIKVWTQCNLFDDNYVGMIGSGDIINQGSSTLSAGNRFQNASGGDLNLDWGVLWQDNNSSNQYYYNGVSVFDDPRHNSGGTGLYCINGNLQSISNLPGPGGSGAQSCSSVISRSKPTSSTSKDSDMLYELSIYPNPASSSIVIASNFDRTMHFNVYNIQGKTVLDGQIVKGKNYLKTEVLESGIYIFRFDNGDVKKVIISKN